ncbi:MAG: hypothetical protein CL693_15300 [Cellvibrionaceae bacterium]|nr:hypothetical protein [Cellvibrionaceae bacterium]|tara:strand:- start:21609 stop:22343 length:735 start_codon:yes stop_codon:yes gene_type:complete
MKSTILFFVTAILWIAPLSYGNDLPDFPFVSVTGSADKEVPPNYANINVQTFVYDTSSTVAVNHNNRVMERVFKLLKQYEVDQETANATDINKREKRRRDTQREHLEIVGYEVSRRLSFQLNELARYSELVNALNAIDFVTEVDGRFDTSERDTVERALQAETSQSSRVIADHLAQSLGVDIDSVYGISQDRNFHYGTARFAYYDQPVSALYAPRDNPNRMLLLVPKSIRLSQQVSVLYRLKSK